MSNVENTSAERSAETPKRQLVSFVIPLMNERETLVQLYDGIASYVPAECDFEVIFVDDGSTDDSWEIILSLTDLYPERVRGIRFRSNRGKAAALTAGYRASRGDVLFTMDADLQDDPKEIPRFLDKLSEGFGLVSGWKAVRHDPWHKVLPSRVFNRMLSVFSGVKLHDHNCGFKCYQGPLAKQLVLHGELHRMVPSLAAIHGFRVAEIVVTHHPREHGVSKYGIERFLRGFNDMLTMAFQRRFRERPSHFINDVGVLYFIGSLLLVATGLLHGIGQTSGIMFVLTGAVFAGMGVGTFIAGQLAELIIRGGLKNTWNLPVVEDTAIQKSYRSGEAAGSISTSYSQDEPAESSSAPAGVAAA